MNIKMEDRMKEGKREMREGGMEGGKERIALYEIKVFFFLSSSSYLASLLFSSIRVIQTLKKQHQ